MPTPKPDRRAGRSRANARTRAAESGRHDAAIAELTRLDAPARNGAEPIDAGVAFLPCARALVGALAAERASVWVFDHDRLAYRCVVVAARDGGTDRPGDAWFEVAADPRFADRLSRARIVRSPRNADHPLERVLGPAPVPVTTTCDAALRRGRTVEGILSIALGATHAWSDDDEVLVGAAADRGAWLLERLTTARLEREIERLDRQLLHAHRMHTIGMLSAGAAHDFNNSLTALCGHVQLLGELADPERSPRIVGAALETIAHSSTLTRQILQLCRHGPHHATPARLDDEAEGLRRLLTAVLGERCQVHIEVARDLGSINVSAVQLAQILVNLAINARDAIGSRDGHLQVSVRDHDPIDRRALGPGSFVLLRVTDDGCGMDEATRARVFEAGFTTKPHGIGFGLTGVLGIVRRAGGSIAVHSEPGVGTTFDVLLPRLPD